MLPVNGNSPPEDASLHKSLPSGSPEKDQNRTLGNYCAFFNICQEKILVAFSCPFMKVQDIVRPSYRVFKFQVDFLKVVQLGAPWTDLRKFFFSGFLKMVNFCQVTKKKDFYSITAAAIAKC